MSTIVCEECKKEIPEKEEICPNCGTRVEGEEKINAGKIVKRKKKLNKCLFVSFVLGLFYLLYSAVYWSGAVGGTSADAAEQIGAGLAVAIVMPHLVCAALAVIFNALGLFMRKRGFALTGAILYTVAIVLFPVYFMFIIIEMILSYIGYARMEKNNKKI